MGWVHIPLLMVVNMRGNTKMIRRKVLGYFYGQMVVNTKDSMSKVKRMVEDFTLGLMVIAI